MRTTTATRWLQRWDAQQERYIPDREERFRVVFDVVRHATGDRPARVVDLGCGPGSLSARLADALPAADVVGVDADPLLLGLATAQTNPRIRFVDADLTDTSWPELVDRAWPNGDDGDLATPWDAAVSSTALHWLDRDALAELYRVLATRIRPGGVFVNADHVRLASSGLDELADAVRAARTRRVGTDANEDWTEWWQALRADDELAPLLDARSNRAIAHGGDNDLTVTDQVELLRAAGFAEVGPVWQFGDDHVLVAIR
jgi:SAM-dependent methyltransferase